MNDKWYKEMVFLAGDKMENVQGDMRNKRVLKPAKLQVHSLLLPYIKEKVKELSVA